MSIVKIIKGFKMRLFIKLLLTKFIIGYVILALYLCLNWDIAKYNLPLPVSAEKKVELVEQRKQLDGDPFKIQLWVNRYLKGKRDAYQFAQYPEETFERLTGDCEDFAILSKYFLEIRYPEVHIVVWEGKFIRESKNYEKVNGTVCHAIMLFKIEDGWGVMDNNGLLMAKGTMEDAIRFDCQLRKIEVKRAYIVRFNHYSYRRLRRVI